MHEAVVDHKTLQNVERKETNQPEVHERQVGLEVHRLLAQRHRRLRILTQHAAHPALQPRD